MQGRTDTSQGWTVHIRKDGGNWDYQIRTSKPHNPAGGLGVHVATVNKYLRDVNEVAALLAAAPRLLWACRKALDWLGSMKDAAFDAEQPDESLREPGDNTLSSALIDNQPEDFGLSMLEEAVAMAGGMPAEPDTHPRDADTVSLPRWVLRTLTDHARDRLDTVDTGDMYSGADHLRECIGHAERALID